MKRFLVLLLVLVAGVVAAALAVPSNAATVNGSAISQDSLNSEVHAIAASVPYQCYLNSQAYLTSNGTSGLPPVVGAGTGGSSGDHPTATTSFVATYLDTAINHELLVQAADQRGVTVTQAQLTDARASYEQEITQVMEEILQTPAGSSPRYSCTLTGQALTGAEVLASLPSWLVDQQVQFFATARTFQEDVSGIGSSDADLQSYFQRHRSTFDTVCFTAASYTSQQAAAAAAAQVASGTPFSQVAAAAQGGPQGCVALSALASELPGSGIATLPVGAVSQPIANGSAYVLLQITSRTPSSFATARPAVVNAVEQAGAAAAQRALGHAAQRSSVSVNPQYGSWDAARAAVLVPSTPPRLDVLNAPANEATLAA